jgi:hypothetical protein
MFANAPVRAAASAEPPPAPGWGVKQSTFLYGAPKNHDHYGLPIFCMDKR